MSKSVGNVVSPGFAMDKFGTDTMRFYLAHDGGIENDADYSNEYISERYRKCLAGGVGNLVQRITKPKAWSVRSAVRAESGRIEYPGAEEHRYMLRSVRDNVDYWFTTELNPRKALRDIMDIVYQVRTHPHIYEGEGCSRESMLMLTCGRRINSYKSKSRGRRSRTRRLKIALR